ncbi:MAG: hypothetical protein LCH79_15270 [Proteobacteria bacterium]|nr:hypothetical protein [Pseudomonadota bacterium]
MGASARFEGSNDGHLMARKKTSNTDPAAEIAAQVRAGTMDAAAALTATADAIATMTGGDADDEPDEFTVSEQEREAEKEFEARRNRINALGHRLLAEAQDQVKLRQSKEECWYQDVRQFNGQYDPNTFPPDESGEVPYGSRIYVPLTRRLVGLCEARLYDMLFQSGERGFILKPTPVPEMGELDKLTGKANPDMPVTIEGKKVPVRDVATAVKELVEEAKRRADGMQREIDDQFAESKFSIHARNAIHDAALLGTGILKGPTVMYKTAKRWITDDQGNTTLKKDRRPVPVVARVDPWNFLPDMSATTIDEAEFVFERHFLTRKQVSALKDMEAVDLEALRRVLGAEPNVTGDNHREKLRAISGASGAPDKRYEVWEYQGPLSAEDLIDCGCTGVDKDDPLQQYTGIVWFCEGIVLKAALNPLDTGELPYRVFTWQKDESSIFGFGLPYEVRDGQISANSAFRAMLDNMGLCALPQVVHDDEKVTPMNGRNFIEPGKFWRNKTGKDAREAIAFINIESRLPELSQIFAAAKALIEEVGTMPAFLQGQDAPAAMNSATAASISWTAANLWVRRAVRNWDDDIITPMVGGFFDWNMQWNDKPEIKGDSQIVALGVSSLAELEGQAQRLQGLVQAAKAMGVPLPDQMMMLRQYARSLKLDPDLCLPTEEQINKMREAAEAAGPVKDPEQRKLDVAEENNRLDAKTAEGQAAAKMAEIAQRERDGDRRERMLIATLMAEQNMSEQEIREKYGLQAAQIQIDRQEKAADRAHEAQMLNAEMQFSAQTGAGV